MKIFLLSDTHGYLDDTIFTHAAAADEIWHAGDFGDEGVLQRLKKLGIVRGVFGNIDGPAIRQEIPERAEIEVEGMLVCMIHIGGYPGRYSSGVKTWLQKSKPALFISGHSHILKAMPDPHLQLFHLNPGAAGKQGWHKVRTAMRLEISHGKLAKLEIVEFGIR